VAHARTFAVALLVLACPLFALAAEQRPSPPQRSLDEELMKDLGNNPVDEVDRELFGPGEKTTKPLRPLPAPGRKDDLKDRLPRELGDAATAEDADPLLLVARQMREVEGLIGRGEAGPPTQDRQKQIVADLQKLIEQARKSCKPCGGSAGRPGQAASRTPGAAPPSPKPGGGKPNPNPATVSTTRNPNDTKPPKEANMAEVLEVMKKVWGSLPDREREAVSQLRAEEFLPKYQAMIEEYFRRLAEGRAITKKEE
jgi:hypothetical protein